MKRGELSTMLAKILDLAEPPRRQKRTLAEALDDLNRITALAREVMKGLRENTVPISGLWVRTEGSGNETKILVLIEREREWFLVQTHPMFMSLDQEISYITEPAGLAGGIPDPLTAKKASGA